MTQQECSDFCASLSSDQLRHLLHCVVAPRDLSSDDKELQSKLLEMVKGSRVCLINIIQNEALERFFHHKSKTKGETKTDTVDVVNVVNETC